ncbi:MAG: CPBP family intramembrane metalloprotease [Paludibacteraceae bacterium]|nr:CPBP family intramembrane metalloprotease [Paludibacteraceae bacterium]
MKKNLFVRLITWLAIMAVLTLIAMGAWMLLSGNSQSTVSLKWLQFVQTVATFLIPPVLCAWLWDADRRPFAWLKMDKRVDGSLFALAVAIMICAVPAINLLADLNSRITLPESMAAWEAKMKSMEAAAAALTERFLQVDNLGGLIINLGLMALLPALSEELSFRGTLQQLIANSQELRAKSHMAIWITAIIFSAIHMQFYGFIPRMLMGAMFGYVFVWTGSLWVPIVMHFTNNALAVIVYYIVANSQELTANNQNIADTIGAGDTWWLGVISLILTSLGLLIFYRRTHKE